MFFSDEAGLSELESSLDDQLSQLDVLLEQLPVVQTGQSCLRSYLYQYYSLQYHMSVIHLLLFVFSSTVEPLLYDHPKNHIGVVV